MFQRLIGHHGAKVGTADADVDNVLDAFAGVALPLAAPHPFGEIGHLAEHGMDLGHDIFSIQDDGRAFRRAQGHVQDGAVFRDVDFLATEHGCDAPAQIGLFGQLDQQLEGLIGDAVLRIIQVEARRLGRQTLAAFRVIGEKCPKMQVLDLLVVGGEGLPRRSLGEPLDRCFHACDPFAFFLDTKQCSFGHERATAQQVARDVVKP